MTDDHGAIPNANAIIEKFGGIRPMAAKLNIAVSTVQGWKDRKVIPANRREQIIAAATAHRLDLGDLLLDLAVPGNVPPTRTETFDAPKLAPAPKSERFDKVTRPSPDTRRTLVTSCVILIAAAIIGGVFALAPHVQTLGEEDQRVAELEAELARMKQIEEARQQQEAQAKESSSFLPDGMKETLSSLEGKVQDLSSQAKNYGAIVEDLQTGNVQQRIAKLEGHMHEMIPQTRTIGLSSMLQKVQGMQQTPQGLQSLGNALSSVLAQMEAAQSAAPAEGEAQAQDASGLASLMQSDPAVAQAFEGVAPEDMKAAAMLLAMAQMRESLARNNDSFETDLKILKMTAAKDDPVLQDAIDRLAPQAQYGVLTPTGLSQEFRGLAGEIVAASLSGQDVSVQDKLKARLNDVMVVEKNGQQVSGTYAQQTITEAQRRLDKGDVQGAVSLLKTLDGPAAEKSQPFINNAEATLASQQLQQALGQKVVAQLQAALHDPRSINMHTLKNLVGQVQNMVPGQGMVSDPSSGFRMMQPSPLQLPTQQQGN